MPNIVPFQFGTQEVRVYLDEQGEPWWEAQNVCEILGIHDVSKAVARLRPREKRSESRNLLIINESGLYRLIMRSNKSEAQRFQDWVFEEVLPSIRKAGRYDVSPILDRHPDLRATADLLVTTAQHRERIEALEREQEASKKQIAQANANAERAMEAKDFYTVAEYVKFNKLEHQLYDSDYRPLSEHLQAYCLSQRIPFRRIPIGGKPWKEEYGYHVSVYDEALPGWLSRRFAQEPLKVMHIVKEERS